MKNKPQSPMLLCCLNLTLHFVSLTLQIWESALYMKIKFEKGNPGQAFLALYKGVLQAENVLKSEI